MCVCVWYVYVGCDVSSIVFLLLCWLSFLPLLRCYYIVVPFAPLLFVLLCIFVFLVFFLNRFSHVYLYDNVTGAYLRKIPLKFWPVHMDGSDDEEWRHTVVLNMDVLVSRYLTYLELL